MLKADQIPDEAMNALLRALQLRKGGREAIAAALSAWPGFEYRADAAFPAFGYGPAAFILPLPQEARDE